ncbi:hypothetical protein CO038_04660 [Candidatus Pacearchaeota archaeon CG_4_9_14_0_2_um_filter_39_13]|nr:class I SAM-dependent methyltransferase [Candidatus Pacearchaeota archaeon]OIO44471.1 MAG: hypothetical protein AUJ64_00030 [Candidatus Pacearchaeota archaeon CG1_02_39_14]PJC44248.1 MAG: hypothetical protein CO038_04660 [Candidatus Pacearchaeota archaeon CG_4_9_14_0_2_um_filter_39_13]
METIDYYDYWNKKREKKRFLLDREVKSLDLIKRRAKKEGSFLDAGCGNGDFLLVLKKKFAGMKLKGLDYSKREVDEAKRRGLDAERVDFEKGTNLKKESFDFAYAGEVIEHLYNPDYFLEQMNSSLKKGGYLLITTPNLCAWYNRILMLFGVQPLFLEPSTKSKFVGSGFLKRFKKEPQPVGHIRIFTYAGLKDLLEMHGFRIVESKGAIYDEGFPKKIWPLDKIFNSFPRLASHFVILARKEKSLD